MSRTEVDIQPGNEPPPRDEHAFFGQPRGLLTLSGLEVWERFSFPGMQAILVVYFADTVAHGGMGMSAGTAALSPPPTAPWSIWSPSPAAGWPTASSARTGRCCGAAS